MSEINPPPGPAPMGLPLERPLMETSARPPLFEAGSMVTFAVVLGLVASCDQNPY